MSNLAKATVSGSLEIKSVNDLNLLAEVVAASGFFSDAKSKAQCAVKILAGMELGLPAFASMTGISIIQGKPTLSANLMAAMVKRSGVYDYRVRRLDDAACEIEFFQSGQSIGVSSFSVEDANKAGIKSAMYGRYPRNMLFARAMSNGVRWYCPDLFLGASVYTPEEIQDSSVIDVQAEANPISAIRAAAATPAVRKELKDWLQWTQMDTKYAQALGEKITGKSSTSDMTDDELYALRNAIFVHGLAANYSVPIHELEARLFKLLNDGDPKDSQGIFAALEQFAQELAERALDQEGEENVLMSL